jgi:sodium/potassium/calcium exchanger 6
MKESILYENVESSDFSKFENDRAAGVVVDGDDCLVKEEEEYEDRTLLSVSSSSCVKVSNYTLGRKDSKKHRKDTTMALWLSLATFGVFIIAIGITKVFDRAEVSTNVWDNGLSKKSGMDSGRRLDDGDNNNNDKQDYDFSGYSCDKIFSVTEANTEERCQFAKTCNDNNGIYCDFIFCTNDDSYLSTYQWFGVLSPFLFVWLVTLFRMLGTTAEDYFSPSLEMFSVKMGLPPRFAGVSLLALGNGAADVSATISAILSDPTNGYKMSLGALTGAAMFIGTVVAATVIIAAGGVPCRGALVRDVCMFIITIMVVYAYLIMGEIGSRAISTFFSMYASFVLIVLIADVYHRAIVLPRDRQIAQTKERSRQLEEGQKAQHAAGLALDHVAASQSALTSNHHHDNNDDSPPPVKHKALNAILTALSNYGPSDTTTQPKHHHSSGGAFHYPNDYDNDAAGWGVSSDQLENERLVTLHGANGILSKKSFNSPSHKTPTSLDEQHDHLPTSPYTNMAQEDDYDNNNHRPESDDTYFLDRLCTVNEFSISGAHNWSTAFQQGFDDLCLHFVNYWNDIFYNEENSLLDKFLLVVELPFTVMRKLTVSLPSEGYYSKGLIAISFALSPIWFGIYMIRENGVNLFYLNGFPYIEIVTTCTSFAALLILRFAPSEDGAMPMLFSAPIALYGFMIAATWIDSIADQLVDLLNFLGIISHIPNSVMGLTILAWGNSMGDLSANVTMAKKGLANMAMTACYAGPVFNILVGLGAGFTVLSRKTGESEKQVDLTAPLSVGFLFLLCNCILVLAVGLFWNNGKISKEYGYCLFALYSAYLVSSLFFEFGDR